MNLQKTETGKFIIKLDATAFARSVCFRKFWLSTIDGYRPALWPIDIEFGNSFHIFSKELEISNGDLIKSIIPAQKYFQETPMLSKGLSKSFLNVEYLTEVCTKYFNEVYHNDPFVTFRYEGKAFVEMNFAIPIETTELAEYVLCGTIDRIGTVGKQGPLAFLDYKSTGKYAKSATEYFARYLFNTQIITYAFALTHIVNHFPDHPLAILKAYIPCAFIQGIFIPSGSTIEFKRSNMIQPTLTQLDMWREELYKLIHKIDAALKEIKNLDGYYVPAEGLFSGACIQGFTPCEYHGSCCAPDPRASEWILKNNFLSTSYNPLRFNDKNKT